jgi:uncharacterized caspase-like protein
MALCALALAPAVLLQQSPQAQEKPLTLSQRQTTQVAGCYALVVGINQYLSEDITPLRFCEADAQGFAEVLRTTCGYGEHVVCLTGAKATRENILTALANFADPQLVKNRDTIILHFSGHGAAIDGVNYLVPYDGSASPQFVKQNNIALDDVLQRLGGSGYKRQVLFIDACRDQLRADGRALGERGLVSLGLAQQYASGMKVLLGTEFGELSREDEQLGHGLFTYYLMKGLRGAAADDTGLVTVGALETYAFGRMAAYSLQNPSRRQVPVSAGEGSSAMPLAVVSPSTAEPGQHAATHSAPSPPTQPPTQAQQDDVLAEVLKNLAQAEWKEYDVGGFSAEIPQIGWLGGARTYVYKSSWYMSVMQIPHFTLSLSRMVMKQSFNERSSAEIIAWMQGEVSKEHSLQNVRITYTRIDNRNAVALEYDVPHDDRTVHVMEVVTDRPAGGEDRLLVSIQVEDSRNWPPYRAVVDAILARIRFK